MSARAGSTFLLRQRRALPIRPVVATSVLIVDDHPLTRDALAQLLAQHVCDVVGEPARAVRRSSGRAALVPDLVLLALTMPASMASPHCR